MHSSGSTAAHSVRASIAPRGSPWNDSTSSHTRATPPPCAGKLQSGRAVNLNQGRPATWLGEPGHEGLNQTGTPDRVVGRDLGRAEKDVHAAGTPGGGSAVGGLAGTTVGEGEPSGTHLEEEMGSGTFEPSTEASDRESQPEAFAGRSGGAVGGTPANKRARGGESDGGGPAKASTTKPRKKKAGEPAGEQQRRSTKKTEKKPGKKPKK